MRSPARRVGVVFAAVPRGDVAGGTTYRRGNTGQVAVRRHRGITGGEPQALEARGVEGGMPVKLRAC